MMFALFIGAVCVAAAIYFVARLLSRRPPAWEPPAQHYAQQLTAVTQQQIIYRKTRIMGRGEFDLFRSAMSVTGQTMPRGDYPFYVFPQVALGQILRTEPASGPAADAAYRAINSKRCDLLLADRSGVPVAVLEYQGSGHHVGGTARQRDDIKRRALERAGIRYVEIHEGDTPAQMERIIRQVLAAAVQA
jgi:hypothetical protein